MAEVENWVDENSAEGQNLWNNTQTDQLVQEVVDDEEEKDYSHIRYNESNQSNFVFYSFIGMSLLCYVIALVRLFHFVYERCLFFSCWISLGSTAGFMALVQFEGSQQFLTRLFKRSTLPVVLCFACSIAGCLFGGYKGHCYISISCSVFQCLCLVVLASLYVTTPITFFLNELSTQKAKE